MKYSSEACTVGFKLGTRNDNGKLYVTNPGGRVNIQPELEQFAKLIEAKAEKNLLLSIDDILYAEYKKLMKVKEGNEAPLEIYEAMINKVRSLSRTATNNIKKAATPATVQDW